MSAPRRSLGLAVLTLGAVLVTAGAGHAVATCEGRPVTVPGATPEDDFLVGTPGDDVIAGLAGNDIIEGRGGNDVICGDEGVDLLIAGPGDDIVNGGGGNADSSAYHEAPGPVHVDLAAGIATGAHGTDQLAAVEHVFGSNFSDTLLGSNDNDTFFPLGGDDVVDGRAGDIDSVSFAFAPGPIVATLEGGTAVGQGSDTLAGIEILSGTPHDDHFVGDERSNGLFAQAGDDVLFGRRGADNLDGGAGNDRLFGGAGENDTAVYFDAPGPIRADLGRESATGHGKDDLLSVENVFGSHFDDVLLGDAEQNLLAGLGGDDLLRGRDGIDWTIYLTTTVNPQGFLTGDTGPVVADLRKDFALNRGDGGRDDLQGIEAIMGSTAPDELRGDRRDNIFLGEDGDDALSGLGGNDLLAGGPDDDVIDGGAGTRDIAGFRAEPAVDVDLASGTATSVAGTDDLAAVEVVTGSADRDVLRGDGGRNWLLAGGGDDDVFGRAGSDILDGERGADALNGGAGRDFCLDQPSTGCESSALPLEFQDELDLIERLEDIAARARRGGHRAFRR